MSSEDSTIKAAVPEISPCNWSGPKAKAPDGRNTGGEGSSRGEKEKREGGAVGKERRWGA